MEAKLARLDKLVNFSFTLPLPEQERDDFIGYCALQIMQGRSIKTTFWYLYVDFVRKNFGRNKDPETGEYKRYAYWRDNLFQQDVGLIPDLCPDPRILEDEIIARLDAAKKISRIMSSLTIEERLIIKFLFYDDIPAVEVAKILGVSPSAISIRVKKLFKRIKNPRRLAKLGIEL